MTAAENNLLRTWMQKALREAYEEGYRDRGYLNRSPLSEAEHVARCWDESETKARIERGEV